MPTTPKSSHAALASALLWLALAGALPAQTSLADSEEQRRRAQAEAEERQRLQDAPTVHLQAPEAAGQTEDGLTLPAEAPSFQIDRIRLETPAGLPAWVRARGESLKPGAPFHFAHIYLGRYAGRRIGPEGLKLILRRLSRRILAQGYTTTRLELPEQDLATGTLTLHLIPGVISAIRFAEPAPSGTWRNAFPARPGDLLNIRDLEQGLEQMKRVPSQDVAIAISPGPQPGESDVVLSVRRGKPWRLGLSLDDSGLPATGQWQSGLNAAWDNPLGGSDLFQLTWNHDVTRYRKGSGTRGGSLGYSVPLGYWSFAASYSQSHTEQRIAGFTRDFVSSGDSRNLELRVGYLFHRDQTRKDSLQLRVGHRASRSFLDGTELDVQRRNNSYLELALLHSQSLGPAHLDLSLAHRRGVSWFGAQPDLAGGADGPTFYYRLNSLDATLTVPLLGLRYTATLHGQHTRNQLFASEYLSLGNRWTVRGFDGDWSLAAENGAYLRNDLEWPLGRAASLYLGIDAGRVYGPNPQPLPGRTLAGLALGLKGVAFKRVGFNVFLGGPLRQPTAFGNRWPVLGVSANLQF